MVTSWGSATLESYRDNKEDYINHLSFLEKIPNYFKLDNYLFVHAGLKLNIDIELQNNSDLYWGRDLIYDFVERRNQNPILKNYDKVFIGHTPVQNFFNMDKPLIIGNLYNLDTGAAFDGKITIYDLDTNNYYQSDAIMKMYPNHKGRNSKSWADKKCIKMYTLKCNLKIRYKFDRYYEIKSKNLKELLLFDLDFLNEKKSYNIYIIFEKVKNLFYDFDIIIDHVHQINEISLIYLLDDKNHNHYGPSIIFFHSNTYFSGRANVKFNRSYSCFLQGICHENNNFHKKCIKYLRKDKLNNLKNV